MNHDLFLAGTGGQGDTVGSVVGSELQPKALDGLHSTVSQAWTVRDSQRQRHVPYHHHQPVTARHPVQWHWHRYPE